MNVSQVAAAANAPRDASVASVGEITVIVQTAGGKARRVVNATVNSRGELVLHTAK